MLKLRSVVVAVSAGLLATAGLAVVPEGFSEVAVYATKSVAVANGSNVLSGGVVVNTVSSDTLEKNFELSFRLNTSTAPGYVVKANRIKIRANSDIEGAVFCNGLDNSGNNPALTCTPLALPVYASLPVFETGPVGSVDVLVASGQAVTVTPGNYRDIVLSANSLLRVAPGVYNVRNFNAGLNTRVVFLGAASVRVAQRLDVSQGSELGPQPTLPGDPPGTTAGDIVFYVAGINGNNGKINANPKAAQIGLNDQFAANVYAPNGTIQVDAGAELTGAFLGQHVDIGVGVDIVLDSFFHNRPPVAVDDTAQALEDSPGILISVLANDFDPDGDNLSLDPLGLGVPGNGTVSIVGNQISYVPNANFSGVDSFTYIVCDDGVEPGPLCDEGAVTVTVDAVDDPPVAFPQDIFTNGATSVQILLVGADPELAGDLTFMITTSPSLGSLGAIVPIDPPPIEDPPGSGTFYEPPITQATVLYSCQPPGCPLDSIDSFAFKVTDVGGNDSAPAAVRMNPEDDEPLDDPSTPVDTVVAQNSLLSTLENQGVSVQLQANAPLGTVLSFTIVSGPSHGSLTGIQVLNDTAASVLYLPATGFIGEDSFTFEACGTVDEVLACDQGVATIEVAAPPAPPQPSAPQAQDQMLQTNAGQSLDINLGGTPGGALLVTGRPRLVQRAAALAPALVGGNVADANPGDGLGDNHNAIPGPVPGLMSAGVGQAGGPGSNGTTRMHIEFDLVGLGDGSSLQSADVRLTTNKGTVDALDTYWYTLFDLSDGALTDSDFQTAASFTGAVMPVPAVPNGTDGSFSFSVLAGVKDVLANFEGEKLIVQGRVDETLTGPARGLQVYTSADGNLLDSGGPDAGKLPVLSLTTPGVVPPPELRIETLTSNGELRDGGVLITEVPHTLVGQLSYTPNAGFVGLDTLVFSINDLYGSDTGLISINVIDFALTKNLTVVLAGAGQGDVTSAPIVNGAIFCPGSCSGSFTAGSAVLLQARPVDAASSFGGWGGDCSGSNPITVVSVGGDKTCTATFNAGGGQ